MTIIQNHIQISKPVEEVFGFLSDLNNHENLMPENITDWTSTVDEAHFSIKGITSLALKVNERIANKEIICIPADKAPFGLKLIWKTEEISSCETSVSFVVEAELNMMMKMMVSAPLQRLVDYEVAKLKDILS